MEDKNIRIVFKIFSSGIFKNIVSYSISFVSRTVFIYNFGKEVLGVNSAVINLMNILSLAELGVGTSFIYILYGALNRGDKDELASIVRYLRGIYTRIGYLIIGLGMSLMPFLEDLITTSNDTWKYVYPCYLVCIFTTSASYFFSAHKRCILIADKKENVVNNITSVNAVLNGVLQIASIYVFENYYVYLVVGIIQIISSNLMIAYVADRRYSFINNELVKPVSPKIKLKVRESISSILVVKLGQAFYKASDNLVISKFLTVSIVALYDNYMMIQYMLHQFLSLAVTSFTSIIGNIAVMESKEALYAKFKKLDMFTIFIFMVCAVGYLNCINPFIEIWLGDDYLLNYSVALMIITRFFLVGVNLTLMVYKDALGLFKYGRFLSPITGIMNLVLSIWWIQFYGLLGVVTASLVCDIFIYYLVHPKAVIEIGMGKPLREYYIRYAKTWICYFLSVVISKILEDAINIEILYIKFLTNGCLSIGVVAITYLLFFNRTIEFKCMISWGRRIFKKKV